MTAATPEGRYHAPAAHFGVLALASSLGVPQDALATAHLYDVDPAQVRRLGYRRYHRAESSTTCTDLAARAGRAALDRAQLKTEDVDFLIVATGSSIPDYLNWDLSTAVAHQLGMLSTPTLLLNQGCAAAVLGFQQIAGLFATRPNLSTILMIAADRVPEEHTNRMRGNLESDGAAAVVLRRDHPSLRWIVTEQLTDARYADFFRLEYGGGAVPTAPDGASNRGLDPAHRVHLYFRDDPEGLLEFSRAVDTRVLDVLQGACKRAGLTVGEVSRLILLNDNQPSMRAIAKLVGIPLERTNAALSATIGHIGGADPLVCLNFYRSRGHLQTGEIIAMAGMSSGMHWFCTLLEV
ncbi:3-oxoacyl-[acyl-carrier-protein] synthase III C-terminal domain-containing protein [Streptomyces olivaceus]|uniref:3-oxoacyl-[acyl-carrier-protein] synthase III C-terminal domain-containing protein n=1 Tax=Streptomyces olivaceus TaxID=47716 RepID=UPI001885828C|nr:3-oxoacyl-[acyl-carrier-protein] synthase III C-terminal domain-containing protein [Streptomyces olivaceus]